MQRIFIFVLPGRIYLMAHWNKMLEQMLKQKARIAKKLSRVDSVAALILINNSYARYKQFEQKLTRQSKLTQYVPKLDTLVTSLALNTELNSNVFSA